MKITKRPLCVSRQVLCGAHGCAREVKSGVHATCVWDMRVGGGTPYSRMGTDGTGQRSPRRWVRPATGLSVSVGVGEN